MKILLVKGHPKKKSFCNALADSYTKGAKEAGHTVKTIELSSMKLEKYLRFDQSTHAKLTPELKRSQELIKWADHLVFTYPTWWATPPALLKLFIELVFQSGFAFKFISNPHRVEWERLLKGRSGRLIVTMDTPPLLYRIFLCDPGGKMMGMGTLEFCGIKPVKKNYFGSVVKSTQDQREKWLKEIHKVGKKE